MYFQYEADTILYENSPEKRMEIYDAKSRSEIRVPLEDAVGRVSSDFIYIYPPGIPIVTPGEIMSKDVIRGIRRSLELPLKQVLPPQPELKLLPVQELLPEPLQPELLELLLAEIQDQISITVSLGRILDSPMEYLMNVVLLHLMKQEMLLTVKVPLWASMIQAMLHLTQMVSQSMDLKTQMVSRLKVLRMQENPVQ